MIFPLIFFSIYYSMFAAIVYIYPNWVPKWDRDEVAIISIFWPFLVLYFACWGVWLLPKTTFRLVKCLGRGCSKLYKRLNPSKEFPQLPVAKVINE